jgi:hypothetical protein
LKRGARGDQNVMRQLDKTCVYTVGCKRGGGYDVIDLSAYRYKMITDN